MVRPTRYANIRESYESRVVKNASECWGWTGAINSAGYGQVWDSVTRRTRTIHRYSYEIHIGPIPGGAEIDHRCRNRECSNPDHLQAVSRKQNNENVGLRADNKSGVRGVSWHKATQKWAAVVGHNGAIIHVGLFVDLEEAERAVVAKRLELHTNNLDDRTGLTGTPRGEVG